MSRWEFMRQLEELLSDIAPAEREEALQYYNDYFNDAGRENEQEVIQALGSPKQVAQIVKEGISGSSQGEFTENGFVNGDENLNEIMKRPVSNNAYEQEKNADTSSYKETKTEKEKTSMPTWAIVLIVIACILCSPVILGVLSSVIGALLSLIVAILAIVLGFGAATLVLYVVAIILVITGISLLVTYPLAGIALIGAGFICAALGILFMLLTVLLAGKCIPGICQGTGYIFSKIFGKKKGEQA